MKITYHKPQHGYGGSLLTGRAEWLEFKCWDHSVQSADPANTVDSPGHYVNLAMLALAMKRAPMLRALIESVRE